MVIISIQTAVIETFHAYQISVEFEDLETESSGWQDNQECDMTVVVLCALQAT